MTISYEYDGTLYLNITNRCTNACEFCVRTVSDGFYSDQPLWLEREPTREEIIADILSHDLTAYRELVFCGYGEPTCRLDDMLWVCGEVRRHSSIPIRINTNGQSDLIYSRRTAPDFRGLADVVSVSLNTADAASYQKLCHCEFGEKAYDALIAFAVDVKQFVPHVILSVVHPTIPDEDIEKCRAIAQKAGVDFRVRELV